VEKLKLQIPDSMVKLLIDVTLSLFAKGGHDRDETEAAAAIVEKAKGKEYGGMFEVAIESWREEGITIGKEKFREEIRVEERNEGIKDVARNALAKGYSFEEVHGFTGLDMETLSKLKPK